MEFASPSCPLYINVFGERCFDSVIVRASGSLVSLSFQIHPPWTNLLADWIAGRKGRRVIGKSSRHRVALIVGGQQAFTKSRAQTVSNRWCDGPFSSFVQQIFPK